MTEDQFGVWLIGYLHMKILSQNKTAATICVPEFASDVLVAARSVPLMDGYLIGEKRPD